MKKIMKKNKSLKLIAFNIIATFLLFLMNNIEAYGLGAIRIGLESRYLNANSVFVGGPVLVNGTYFRNGVNIRVGGASSTHVELIYGGTVFKYSHSPFIVNAATDFGIYIGGRSYRGFVEVGRQRPGYGITPVNVVDLEDYLKSVVPSEMPSAWHIEALRAQAVAARTFAMYRRGSHNHLGYELCDTVFSQVYNGIGWENERTTTAVTTTRGRVAVFNGLPILAVYSSSNGGFSESSEYVWTEAVPHLRAVPDVYETGGLVWDRTFTASQIQNALPASSSIGSVVSIAIEGRTPGGRAHSLVIRGTNGSHRLYREQIRTFFSAIDGSLPSRVFQFGREMESPSANLGASLGGGPVMQNLEQAPIITDSGTSSVYVIISGGEIVEAPSIMYAIGTEGVFTISRQPQPTNFLLSSVFDSFVANLNFREVHYFANGPVTIHGRGFGHGVGMSQFGAYSMARVGYNYVQILMHYFSGINVVTFN